MGAVRGSASAMMSFHDFGHALHRYGILPFANRPGEVWEEKKSDEGSKNPAAALVRTVFENANRGSWPGDGKVGQPLCARGVCPLRRLRQATEPHFTDIFCFFSGPSAGLLKNEP